MLKRNLFLASGLALIGAGASGCGDHVVSATSKMRRTSFQQNSTGGGDPPSANPTPNPTDPDTGLKIIGSVTVHTGRATDSPAVFSTDWVGTGILIPRFGPLYKFGQVYAACTEDHAAELAATAFAVGAYIQANASTFGKAGADMADYFGVYRIGGATAAEFLGACFATFSVGEWTVILLAAGTTVYALATQIKCYAAAFGQ